MPFICMANANVPDGTLQVTDLWPNVSQDNNPTNPPGQTRYINRALNQGLTVDPITGLVQGFGQIADPATIEGLQAYLVDRVEPGAVEQASAPIVFAALPAVNDRIVFGGTMFFEFAAGGAGSNDATTTGLVGNPFIVGIAAADIPGTMANFLLVMNDAAAKVTMRPLLPANIYPAAVDADAPSADCVVNAMFNSGAGEVANLGATGDLAITLPVVGSAARITIPTTGRMGRTNEAWSGALLATASAAILNLVDTGADCTLAAVNAVLNAPANGETDLDGTASASTGTLADLLSILAGRSYRVARGASKFTAAVAPDTAHLWSPVLRGSFTQAFQVFDSIMSGGVIAPTLPWVKHGATVIGGDTENREIKGIRSTFDSTDFQASLDSGQLAGFASGSITLFPDSDVLPHIPTTYQKAANIRNPILSQRLVTVYDDDGTALV